MNVIEAAAAIAVLAMAYACIRAAALRADGGAGAAVRLTAVLVIPALVLAFARAFYWPLSLAVSLVACALAWPRRGTVRQIAFAWTPWALALLGVLGIVALRAALAVASVPSDVDSIYYHLPMSASYLQVHAAVPEQIMYHPGNAELLDAIGLGALGGVGGQTLTQAAVALILFLAAYGAAEAFGAPKSCRIPAACAAFAIPMIGDQLFTAQNDVLVAALLIAAIVLWPRNAMLAAVSVGLLAGVKFTGAALSAVCIPIIWSRRASDYSWKHAAVAALIACPWYVRNAVETGNPFFLGHQTVGISSAIAGHPFSMAPFWVLTALRNYGGILALAGIPGMMLLANAPDLRAPLARRMPLLIVAIAIAWCFMPNTAETHPGTLDQIHSGWSLRYALAAVILLSVAAVVWLWRIRPSLATAAVCLFLAFAFLRQYHEVAPLDPAVLAYVPALAAIAALACVAFAMRPKPAAIAAVCACVAFAAVATRGGERISEIWNLRYDRYVQVEGVLASPQLQAARRIATIQTRPLPVMGPQLRRWVLPDSDGSSFTVWKARIEALEPQIIVANDLPDTHRMSDEEIFVRSWGQYRLVFDEGGGRVYARAAQAHRRTSPSEGS
jgi:hypothetical protein